MDFTRIAEGFGAVGASAEEPEDLKDALVRALDSNRPYLLDVVVDPAVPKFLG